MVLMLDYLNSVDPRINVTNRKKNKHNKRFRRFTSIRKSSGERTNVPQSLSSPNISIRIASGSISVSNNERDLRTLGIGMINSVDCCLSITFISMSFKFDESPGRFLVSTKNKSICFHRFFFNK